MSLTAKISDLYYRNAVEATKIINAVETKGDQLNVNDLSSLFVKALDLLLKNVKSNDEFLKMKILRTEFLALKTELIHSQFLKGSELASGSKGAGKYVNKFAKSVVDNVSKDIERLKELKSKAEEQKATKQDIEKFKKFSKELRRKIKFLDRDDDFKAFKSKAPSQYKQFELLKDFFEKCETISKKYIEFINNKYANKKRDREIEARYRFAQLTDNLGSKTNIYDKLKLANETAKKASELEANLSYLEHESSEPIDDFQKPKTNYKKHSWGKNAQKALEIISEIESSEQSYTMEDLKKLFGKSSALDLLIKDCKKTDLFYATMFGLKQSYKTLKLEILIKKQFSQEQIKQADENYVKVADNLKRIKIELQELNDYHPFQNIMNTYKEQKNNPLYYLVMTAAIALVPVSAIMTITVVSGAFIPLFIEGAAAYDAGAYWDTGESVMPLDFVKLATLIPTTIDLFRTAKEIKDGEVRYIEKHLITIEKLYKEIKLELKILEADVKGWKKYKYSEVEKLEELQIFFAACQKSGTNYITNYTKIKKGVKITEKSTDYVKIRFAELLTKLEDYFKAGKKLEDAQKAVEAASSV